MILAAIASLALAQGMSTGVGLRTGSFSATLLAPGATGGPLLLNDGAVGAPAYSFASESTTGLYRIGFQDIAISVAGSKYLEFSAGAGVSNPLNVTYAFYLTGTNGGIQKGAAGPMNFTTEQVDGSSVVGFVFNTSSAWSTSGAKLFSGRTGGSEKWSMTFDGYLASITPHTLTSMQIGAAMAAGALNRGHVLPARAFTVTFMTGFVSGASGGGAAQTTVRASDGTNNCDCNFACNTSTNTTGSKRSTACSGTCAFPANAALAFSVQTAGCTTTQPTFQNLDVEGNWQ